jgi:hypothetical protein
MPGRKKDVLPVMTLLPAETIYRIEGRLESLQNRGPAIAQPEV